MTYICHSPTLGTLIPGNGAKSMLDKVKTLDLTPRPPEAQCYFSPAYEITYSKLIGSCMHVISTESHSPHRSRIREHRGTGKRWLCGFQVCERKVENGWGVEGQQWRTEAKWKSQSGNQFSSKGAIWWWSIPMSGPPLEQRVTRSSGDKQRFTVQKVSRKSECRHTYTHDGFQAFCFLITFQFFLTLTWYRKTTNI